ncbi:peptidase inhibitor family I36 protein [Catenuloplanes atrovinosus]|uniref:Peptidase inhibitor family I36 n=1 Tax=Catenuloplanes atrovinosus TaxID=137266 RepID=A0AAE4C9K4_9ACTN|nr:peptidase inhibitor family I36 protein [Catenuloplanes atrovinosus]MDR7274889.1 hypothetical protein [Catenuloplanes atrovinosus]
MKIRSILLALPIAAALTLAPGLAAPASAASTCEFTRTLCLWENPSYGGARFTVQALNPSVGTCVDLAWHGWGSGRAESARNTASTAATLYTGTACTGTAYQIPPGASIPSIAFNSNSVYVY